MNEKMKAKSYPLYVLTPILLVFTVFYIWPAVYGLILSLTDASLKYSGSQFVGLENYKTLFQTDGRVFFTSIKNQFIFAIVNDSLKTIIGLLIALLLNEKFKGRNFLRTIVYMPMMFSTVVISLIFGFIMRPDGFLNMVLRNTGLGFIAQDWLGNFDLALYSVAAIDAWIGMGFTVVIIMAGLQSVPQEMLECGEIDGAGPVRKFLNIKLPFIMPSINLSFLMGLIYGLKAFDSIYALTRGGPGHATEVITTFLIKAMSSSSLGYASAINFCQFVLVTVIALSINHLSSRKELEL